MKKTPVSPAPWLKDGAPHLWIRVGKFALMMNRSHTTIQLWARNGTLREFGYATYRDIAGTLFIRIQENDYAGLMNITRKRKKIKNLALVENRKIAQVAQS